MRRKRSKAEIEESRFHWLLVADSVTRAFKFLVIGGTVVGCFYFMYKSLGIMAGKSTKADMVFNVFTDLKVNHWIGYVFGVGGIAYGKTQRNFRTVDGKSHMDRITKFESLAVSENQGTAE